MLLGIAGAIPAHIFLLVLLVVLIGRKMHSQPAPRATFPIAIAVAAVTALLYVRYAGWMLLIVEIGGPGPNGNSYLSFATAEHHSTVAKILIDKGVPVDAPYAEHTPLNGACAVRDVQMARYLIGRGANLEAAPDCQSFYELTEKPKPLQVPSSEIDVHP
jgi:ankyrin repeat protein